jgi:hypothetical protein
MLGNLENCEKWVSSLEKKVFSFAYCKSPFFSAFQIIAFLPLKKGARDNLERDNWHRAIIWCSLKFGARDNLARAIITDALKFVSAEMRSENSRFSRKVRGFSGKFRGFRRKSGKHQILASAKF